MPRLSRSNKGQWYIISAVIASGALLTIAIIFKSYFVVDSSKVALMDETYHFNVFKNGLQRTIQLSSCSELDRNLREFIQFSRQKMAQKGYLLTIFYTINDCATKDVSINVILLQSDRAEIWEGQRPEIGEIGIG